MYRRQLVALLLATAALTIVVAVAAEAHYVRVNWSRKGDCDAIKDPVTVVVESTGVSVAQYIGRAIRDVESHTTWRNDDHDAVVGPFGEIKHFTHSFLNGHGCAPQSGERADASGAFHDRYHVRFLALPDLPYLFLTPHKEDWVADFPGCPIGSHAVEPGHADPDNADDQYYMSGYYSGFDSARDRLVNRIVANTAGHRRHSVTVQQWRNTRSIKQCNGWYSGSGGTVFQYRLRRG